MVGWMDGVFRFVCLYVRMYVCMCIGRERWKGEERGGEGRRGEKGEVE